MTTPGYYRRGNDGKNDALVRFRRGNGGKDHLLSASPSSRAMPTRATRGLAGVGLTSASLTTYTGSITSGQTLTRQVVTDPNISGLTGVTFNQCLIRGKVTGGVGDKTRTFVDCDFDGLSRTGSTDSCFLGIGASFTRCSMWGAPQGISGHNFDALSTWIGDLAGVAGGAHAEPVLISRPGATGGSTSDVLVDGCYLDGTYAAGSPGDQMSAALACYNHTDGAYVYGPVNNIVVRNSWLRCLSPVGTFTAFWSTNNSGTRNAMSNCLLIDNIFVRTSAGQDSTLGGFRDICSPVNYGSGTGNLIRGNVYDTGEALPSPNVPA